jgi:predicted nucleotidyltransferase
VRSTARKTYGKTASGKQITDELIDVLARKAEAGYEIEEVTDRAGRLGQLARRLRRADGLDRDALKCIEELTEIREDVHHIAAAHGATNVRLLGSAGRGKQDASSNLGLLVDMAEGRTLFDLIALSNELGENLGVEVDVVTEASLSPYVRDRVLAEAVALGGDQA